MPIRSSPTGCWSKRGEQADGRVGRPQQLLDVVPASRRFIGMKLMADEVLGVTTDLRANVLAQESRQLKADGPRGGGGR